MAYAVAIIADLIELPISAAELSGVQDKIVTSLIFPSFFA
jgi:hypothetical protein